MGGSFREWTSSSSEEAATIRVSGILSESDRGPSPRGWLLPALNSAAGRPPNNGSFCRRESACCCRSP